MKDKIQILVLDDEFIVCDRLKSSLEKLGFYVETFTESQAALDRFAEHHFHIVISDLKMNAPDGMDVLRFVKGNSPRTRVIIVTGFATVDKAREAIKSGAADFIAKPFKMSELRDIVRRIAREFQTGLASSESRNDDAL
ncbi:MAG: response regulator [Candidatus Omnitrophota bacterium]